MTSLLDDGQRQSASSTAVESYENRTSTAPAVLKQQQIWQPHKLSSAPSGFFSNETLRANTVGLQK